MEIRLREYAKADVKAAAAIWNQVVEDGEAFPQKELLTEESGNAFFLEQSYTGIAYDAESEEILGIYILHPNNIGRCGHLGNASYAVRKDSRGRQIGESLVRHSIQTAGELGFRVLQFNAVVASNHVAIHLYEKIGFHFVLLCLRDSY